ncbi:MAG: hypothetical protein H7A23_12925 [Leptospiraceae bacterium]|nr:hypothetical protein [Leptospiraceae bacterium]
MENAIVVKGTLVDGFNIILNESIDTLYGEEIEVIIRPIYKKKENNIQKRDILEEIKYIFEKYKNVVPFKEIEDPIQWQRQIRDEWER